MKKLVLTLGLMTVVGCSAEVWGAALTSFGSSGRYSQASSQAHGRYNVTVTRKDSNVYVDRQSGAVILTRYCYEYAYSEDAILIWEGDFSSKLVFLGSNGESCDVKDVL